MPAYKPAITALLIVSIVAYRRELLPVVRCSVL